VHFSGFASRRFLPVMPLNMGFPDALSAGIHAPDTYQIRPEKQEFLFRNVV
jgi:hypothetical protein